MVLVVETRLVKTQNYVQPVQPKWQTPEKPPWVDGPPSKLVSFQRDTETGVVTRLASPVHAVPTLPTLVRGPLDPETMEEMPLDAQSAQASVDVQRDEQLVAEAQAKLAADRAADLAKKNKSPRNEARAR